MYSFFNDATFEIYTCDSLQYLYNLVRSEIRTQLRDDAYVISHGTIYKHDGEMPKRGTPVCHFRSFAEFPAWYEEQVLTDLDLSVRAYLVLRRRVGEPATRSGVIVNSNLRSLYEVSRMRPQDTCIRNYGRKCAADLRRALRNALTTPVRC